MNGNSDVAKIAVFKPSRVRLDDPEPALADLLDDPVTHAVMRRDGVTRQFLVQTLEAARRALQSRRPPELCCA